MNHPDANNRFSIVDIAIDLNNQFKEETGIDLLQKSPQSLASLCKAESNLEVSRSLDKISDSISCAPDAEKGLTDIGDSIFKGLNNIAKAIQERGKQ